MQSSATRPVHGVPAAGQVSDRVSVLDRASQLEQAMAGINVALAVRVPPADPTRGIDLGMQKRTYRELAVVNMQCGPLSAARTSRQAAESDGALMTALLVRSGTELIGQDDSTTLLRKGDLLLWNCERPARFTVGNLVEKRLMVVPTGLLTAVGSSRLVESGLIVRRRSPATELLDHFLESLLVAGEDLGSTAVCTVRNAALELLVGSLHPSDGGGGPAPSMALRPAIEDWIDHHLPDTVITPASVAAAHAVSVRTVHRMFAETGDTLGSVVRLRRLMRARRELECTHHSITAIASRWGYSDSSHFTRTFKHQFGMSPTDHRALCRQDDEGREGEVVGNGVAVQSHGTRVHAPTTVRQNTLT
ncbi:MAG: hypothetical protein DI630_28060 [Gordonia sp. (in: high G+C Gram-positive bacteria)]|nr:MAG: hypothetical protein DI630_28060 [Gordonia sp. (in: high G+C Gram-positive bacteria)]